VENFKNIKLLEDPSVAATLYYHPPNQQNFEFWNIDRMILMALGMHNIVKNHEDDMYNENVVVGRLPSFIITQLFGKTDYDVKDHQLMGFSKSTNSIYPELKKIHTSIGKEKMDGLYNALNECIGDDYSGPKSNRVYLLCLHQYDDISRVYMTMSIRRLSSTRIEHRHIQQSVRSIVEPTLAKIWGYSVPPAPQRLSLLMHSTSLRFIQKLHPEVTELKIDPLHSMYTILQKQGFVPKIEKKPVYYDVMLQKDDYIKLRDFDAGNYVTPGKLLEQCMVCNSTALLRCESCLLPIVCKKDICLNSLKNHLCEY
jgi:hypothetical protein